MIAPCVERFEYLRQLTRIARGEQPPESLRDVQELYDTVFLEQSGMGSGARQAYRVRCT